MEIRPLQPEEMPRYATIVKDAFVLPNSFKDVWLPNTRPEDTRGLFDERGRLVAALKMIWNELWLGQRPVKMAGITSVATPPEYRRKGYLKQLLLATLNELREKGLNISALYPFDFAFYRKFGYELAGTGQEIRVKMPGMGHFKSRSHGEWVQHGPEDWEQFKPLYDQYCLGRFGRITRPDQLWWSRSLFTARTGGAEKPINAYLWRDVHGKARAYLFYYMKPLGTQWERDMMVREMVWLDEAAHHEIFSFIANHDSQAGAVVWDAEPDDDIYPLLPNPREAKVTRFEGYMLRLLDVERALTERAWPELKPGESCAFSLALRDDVLPWNHHRTYRLEFQADGRSGSRVEVTAVPGNEHAGLACDVRTLAQLYSGYLSPRQAARLRLLEVHRAEDLEIAQSIFSPPGQPASFMNDFW